MKKTTKMTKRFLAYIMALAMIVTSLPTFAISANAKNAAPTSYAYLTNGIDSGFTNTGSVTWDSTEKAAKFNGDNYLTLSNFSGFSNVTSSTGFTVSFDFKRDTTSSDYNFVFTLTNGSSNANRFTFNAGSNTNDPNRRGLVIGAVNGAYNWYNTELFGNSTYTTETGTGHGPWHPDDDTWYNVTLYMNPVGGGNPSNLLWYYVNGTLVNKFKIGGNWGANGAGDTTNEAVINALSSFTTLKIGAGAENGEKFKGYIKNVQLYSYAAADSAKNLKTAMDAYEAKMADGKIYTNLSNAYTAYQAASTKYDSYVYGEASATTNASAFNAAAQDLSAATGAMQPWEEYSGTKDMYFGTIATGAYSNILYAPGEGTGAMSFSSNYVGVGYKDWATDKRAWFKAAAPSSVVLYYNGDLSKLYFPVGFEAYGTTNSDSNAYRTINYVDLNDDANLELTRYWHGYQQTWNNTYGINYLNAENNTQGNDANDGIHCSVGYSSSNTKDHILSKDGSGKNRFWVNIAHIKALSSSNTLSKTSVTYRMKITKPAGSNITNPGSASATTGIYVVNYYQLTQAIKNNKSKVAGIDVSNYKEGGLADAFTAYDNATGYKIESTDYSTTASTYYSNAQSHCTTYASAITGLSAPTADSNYSALKDAIDHNGAPTSGGAVTSVLDAYSKKTDATPYAGQNSAGISKATFSQFVTAYETAKGEMAALYNQSVYPQTSQTTNASTLLTKYNALAAVNVPVPTLSPSGTEADPALIGAENASVTINNTDAANNGAISYTITYDNGAAVNGSAAAGQNATVADVFANRPDATTATVSAHITTAGDDSAVATSYYTRFLKPTVSSVVLNRGEAVSVTSNNGSNAGTFQYSSDGSNWTDFGANGFAPFSASAATASTVQYYIREKITVGNSVVVSASEQYTFYRAGSLVATVSPASEKGEDYYNPEDNPVITIATADTYTSTVKYSMWVGSNQVENASTYTAETDLYNSSTMDNAVYVKIEAWAEGAESQKVTTYLYNESRYSPLAYRESFDDVTVTSANAKTSLTTRTATGKNAEADGLEAFSVVKGAGTKSASGSESHSWRNNVLKINANATAPGPVVTLSENPLSTAGNADVAKVQGVTISFWRHIEDTSGNTVNLPEENWDDTGYDWKNALAFQKSGDNSQYYIIEVNGVNSHRIDGNNYTDFAPEAQDNTGHEEGNYNGEWEHVAVTINPNTGIKVYTNGVEHDTKFVKIVRNGTNSGATTTDHDNPLDTTITASAAQDILDFITRDTTEFTFDNGVLSEGNPYNLFLDDIRLYTKTMTQVEINNMYVDKNADIQTNVTSTSHDPTTVTVYTLATAKGGKAAGSKVGQEFIDYYEVSDSEISNIEYYSFGTGMTIYKADDESYTTLTGDKQIKWEVLGDSHGRCGYQNEELFGGKYTTELSEVRNYLGVNLSTGAGYLVWAPHVMYNLNLNKWVYYAAMSSWGAVKSATFYATSDNPISGYDYQGMVYKSNSYHPNAIDSCIFYGYDSNHKPKPNELYMVIGSWGHTHLAGRYDAIYGTELNANGSAPSALTASADTLEEPGTPNGSGVNSYALVRGYTGDLEKDENGNDGESGGSGEGAYVQYINGYYYLFVSYGQNEGSYTERVFRSTTPMGNDNDAKTAAGLNTSYTEYTGANGFQANDDRVISKTRGDQILSPFDNSIYTKIYRSTGHSSVYKAKNDKNEWVWINTAHARPYASETHDWTAIQDNALAKRQSGGVTGNVCFNNMLAVTENGWLVMFPYQYNGTDTVYEKVTASQFEGLYAGNNLRKRVDSNWGAEYQYTFLANKDDATDSTGTVYGVRADLSEFRMKFKLVRNADGDKVQYIRLYNDTATFADILNNSASVIHEGVIAVHKKNGKKVYELATLNITSGDSNCGLHYWAYKMSNLPDVDNVISHGDQVAMDDVIYTHASDEQILALATIDREDYKSGNTYNDAAYKAAQKAAIANPSSVDTSGLTEDQIASARNSAYAVYGQEISDNETYGHKDSNGYYDTGGEKFTTITTKYPNSIEIDKRTGRSAIGSIVSLNDTEYCREYGETGSSMYAEELNSGYWCTKTGTAYTPVYSTDEAAAAAVASNPNLELYKVYIIKGKVSTFFRYYDNEADGKGVTRNGYPKVGVTLVVAYEDITDGSKHSEFEFCYVMPNPAWAHTLAAIKNNNSDTGNDRNSSYGTFNRFVESTGTATSYYSSMLYYATHTNTFIDGYGHGVSGYLTDFSTSATGKDLNTLDKIKTLYNFYDSSIGVNSGSFSAQEHNDDAPNAYTATPDVVDVRYYIDYSDKDNYIKNNSNTGLITTTSNNTTETPTGFQFKMRTSNFLWENYSKSAIFDMTSYARNNTGMNVTYTSTPVDTNGQSYLDHINDNSGHDDRAKNGAIFTTNLSSFNSDVFSGGKKTWVADEMLFLADERKDSNAIFGNSYRNRYLYYFTNNATQVDTAASKHDDGYIDGSKSTKPKFHDYSSQTAYITAANGKLATNAWQGTAIFTGKNRVTPPSFTRTYDSGYWYTHDTGRADNREDWTSDLATAQAGKSYGQVDVSAEMYSNYILEMGNYHKVSDTGVDGGRFLGKENYHYYNIGVATCDKGAARDFAKNFAFKRLQTTKDADGFRKVTLDANGRPTVDTTPDAEHNNDTSGNLYVENVSTASYREYIQALARLEWFVHNPQNTLQNDLKGEDEYKNVSSIQSASATEYTTAYASGDAIYKTNTSNIDVFGTGTTSTDAVQAQLIADVIKAYENLFILTDYNDVKQEYDSITFYDDNNTVIADKAHADSEDVKKITVTKTDTSVEPATTQTFNYTSNAVTEDSWAKLIKLVNDTSEYFDYNTDNVDAENYWRGTKLSGEEYNNLKRILENGNDSLMPVVDTASLNQNITNKKGNNNSYSGTTLKTPLNGGETEYTYASWKTMLDTVLAGEETLGAADDTTTYSGTTTVKVSDGTEQTFINGRYKVNSITAYSFGDDVKFYKQEYVNTAFNEDGSGGTPKYDAEGVTNCSDIQKEVYDDSATVAASELTAADSASAYNTYNAAYAVVNSVDKNKYTAEGLAQLNTALATRNSVYKKLNGVTPLQDDPENTELSRYKAYSGNNSVTADTEFKITTVNETDPITATLLSTANALELEANKATYVKQVDVSYTITKDGTQLSTSMLNPKPYYGDTVDFEVSSEQKAASDSVVFSVQKYEKYENNAFVNAKGATKVSTNGNSISQVVNTPMAVTAVIKTGGTTSDVKVTIKDIYGKLVDVFYVASGYPQIDGSGNLVINSNGDVYAAPAVAFYDFVKWNKVAQSEGAVTYRPEYAVKGEMCAFNDVSTLGGTLTNKNGGTVERAQRDAKLTLDYTANDGFYAWASIPKKWDSGTKGSKYQIISYNPTYWFYATADEDFYPIIKTNDKYYVKTGASTTVELTASMVDSFTYLDYSGIESDAEKTTLDNTIFKSKLDQRAPFISISYEQVTEDGTKYRFTSTMRITFYDSNDDGKNDLSATITTLYTKKAIYVQAEDRERTFIKGATGVTPINITNVLDNGQFEVSARYPVTASGGAIIRGCIEYPISYSGDTLTLCDYSTITPLEHNLT